MIEYVSRKLEKEMAKLCEEKHTVIETETFVREEGKTCLPFPVTTSAEVRIKVCN